MNVSNILPVVLAVIDKDFVKPLHWQIFITKSVYLKILKKYFVITLI